MMTTTLAFDIYGTLIDTSAVMIDLQKLIGNDIAPAFSKLWRDKQIEYTFRRGLMRSYKDFSVCTRDALEYACNMMSVDLSANDKSTLMDAYLTLPVFPDVINGLEVLKARNYDFYAFSNGKSSKVKELLRNAGILRYFIDIVSVDEIKTFKPNPDVYKHLLKRCGSKRDSTWLISSNPFDVVGALSSGMQSVWLQRSSNELFDPWDDISPPKKINLFSEIDEVVS